MTISILATDQSCLCVDHSADGYPKLLYFGPGFDDQPLMEMHEAKAHGLFDDGEKPGLFALAGDGWAGTPVLDGLTRVRTATSEILDSDMVCQGDLDTGSRLELQIARVGEGIKLRMGYRPADNGNTNLKPPRIVLPLSRRLTDFIHFDGRWSSELQPQRGSLHNGIPFAISRAGNRHSHNGFPGLVLGDSGFGEDHGQTIGVHFGAKGDFALRVEVGRDGTPILVAEDLATFTVQDENGFIWSSDLYLTASAEGLNGLRKAVPSIRRAVRGTHELRKVQLNTWEGVYFDHDAERLKDIARAGAALGAEHFVLDDGWFGRRTNDGRGLGDWDVRTEAYPEGLSPLISYVTEQGMSFGLWVEPEMVSADSALFEQRPDWIVGDKDQPLGRHQYGLDLTNDACFEHLQSVMRDIAAIPNVSSLKWDCNRDLPGVSGDYTDRAHALMAQTLQGATQPLWIEACASGGGRLSAGFSNVCERYWLSDAHDPDIKLPMLGQAALFFEHSELGTHIGAGRSHLTGRHFSIESRAAVAAMGHMGLELDPTALSEHEQHILKQAITYWKAQREWSMDAPLLQIPHPDPALTASAIVSPRGDRAMLCVLQMHDRRRAVPAPLQIKHLSGDLDIKTVLAPQRMNERAKSQPNWLEDGLKVSAERLGTLWLPLPILAPGEALLIDISQHSRQTAS